MLSLIPYLSTKLNHPEVLTKKYLKIITLLVAHHLTDPLIFRQRRITWIFEGR
jgi:hypothetical protein